jgi:hypothetical protein
MFFRAFLDYRLRHFHSYQPTSQCWYIVIVLYLLHVRKSWFRHSRYFSLRPLHWIQRIERHEP